MGRKTERFVVKKSLVTSRLILKYGKWIWISMGIVVLATIITFAATSDYRWIIIALMIIMLIIPMSASLLLIDKGFRYITTLNTIKHSIELMTEGAMIRCYIPNFSDDGEQCGERVSQTMIPYSDFKGWELGMNEIIFNISGSSKNGLLFLPVSSFNDSKEFKLFTDELIDNIK